MPFKKGEVANPKGRPPKGRALTELLTKAGSKGKRNEKLAELVWAFATEGKVTVGGRTYKAEDIGDLLAAWKWIYSHIDGPAPASLDVTSGGEKIEVNWSSVDYRHDLPNPDSNEGA